MPDPGQMREQVTVQSPTEVSQGGGGSSITWSDVATFWAEVRALRGREQIEALALEAATMYRITRRYTETITERQRLTWKGRILNIRSVVDPDGRRQWTEILAETGVAT